MKKYLEADLYRYNSQTSRFYFLKALLSFEPGFTYTYFLRHASLYPRHSLRGIFFRVLLRHYSHKYGFQIPSRTKIGKGLYINHFGTIVINGGAELGENCNITHSITIGQANRGKSKGYPKIGSRVWIGTGSVIVGNVSIGDNVLIAPNSYINFDVPSNSIVVGHPGKIIPNENATENYITNVLNQ